MPKCWMPGIINGLGTRCVNASIHQICFINRLNSKFNSYKLWFIHMSTIIGICCQEEKKPFKYNTLFSNCYQQKFWFKIELLICKKKLVRNLILNMIFICELFFNWICFVFFPLWTNYYQLKLIQFNFEKRSFSRRVHNQLKRQNDC